MKKKLQSSDKPEGEEKGKSAIDQRLQILHVDDNVSFLKLFSITFQKFFDVISVKSGIEAIEALKTRKIDAIILDYEMPEMNGLELLKIVKKEYPDIPVIFYTGQGNEEVAREAFISGASDYFVKEVRGFVYKEKLTNSIIKSIEKRKAEETLREREEWLSTLIDAMPNVVYFKDGEGRWLVVNNYGLKLFQLDKFDYQGKKDRELANYAGFYRDALLYCEETDERTWKAGKMTIGEEIIPRPDGSPLTFDVIKVPLFNPDGSRKGLVVVGRDITERKQTQKKIEHLNSVLMAIRSANELVVREKDKEKLIQGICNRLVESRGYKSAWITLFNEGGELIQAKEAGIGEDFLRIYDSYKHYKPPYCTQQFSKMTEDLIIRKPSKECLICPLTKMHEEIFCIVAPLKYSDKLFGFLSVSIPSGMEVDDEEKSLIREMAEDIAYAIENLENEEKRKNAELHIKHLNGILNAVRNINQLIVLEKNREALIQGACEKLTQAREYNFAIIVLVDNEGKFLSAREAGFGKDFDEILRKMEKNQFPPCILKSSIQKGVFVISEIQEECETCHFFKEHKPMNGMVTRLEHDGQIFGYLIVSSQPDMWIDEDERKLFQEVAGDIAYALHSLDVEEERNKARQELDRTFTELNSIFKALPDLHFRTRYDGTLLDCKSGISSDLYASPEVFLGKKVQDILPPPVGNQCYQAIKDALRTNSLVIIEYSLPVKMEEQFYEARILPLNNEEVITIVRNITDRKQIEKSLKEQEEFYRNLFENVPVGIGITDMDGNILAFNKVMLDFGGYSREDMDKVKNIKELYYNPEDRDKILNIAKLQQFLERIEVQFKAKDGSPYNVLLTLRQVQISGKQYWQAIVENTSRKYNQMQYFW